MDFIDQNSLDPTLVMNTLQDNGICSDLCVEVGDVGNGGECVRWLHQQKQEGRLWQRRPAKI